MRRLFCVAVLLVLCAFGGRAEVAPGDAADVPAAVDAAATEAPADFAETDAPYDGEWLPFEDGFRLYLPRGWAPVALSEAQRDAGLFYRAGSGDGMMGLAVGYMRAGSLATVDELARDFEAVGYESVTQQNLNGIPAIGFERPRDGYRGVAFFHPVYPDYVLYVYVSPLGPRVAEADRIGRALLASIGPIGVPSERLKNN